MSIRTIVEINHDYLHDLAMDVEPGSPLWGFLESLAGCYPEPPNGIKVLRQRHHSEKVTVEVE